MFGGFLNMYGRLFLYCLVNFVCFVLFLFFSYFLYLYLYFFSLSVFWVLCFVFFFIIFLSPMIVCVTYGEKNGGNDDGVSSRFILDQFSRGKYSCSLLYTFHLSFLGFWCYDDWLQ